MVEKLTDKKTWLFVTGVALVVFFSIVIGYLHIGVLYLFGIPIVGLMVGIILVWLGKTNLRNKIAVSVVPIPLVVTVFFLSLYLHKAEPETFLIPNDLRGEIVVFYDEPCGQLPVYRNGRRVYEISTDGVLITQFKKNHGYLDQKFYLADSDNSEIEIPYFQRQNFETEGKEWSLYHSTSVDGFTKESVGAFWAYGSETYFLSHNSFGFIISDYHYWELSENDRWLEGKKFAEIASNQLKNCRQSH